MNEIIQSNLFDVGPHLVALAAAYLLALPIGWNREKEERSAGLRTFPLVAVASCGFVQAAEALAVDEPEAMARIVEGIITGMGFIGGGAILRLKDSVKGTATAASLWVTGAVGVAVGLGSFDVAIVLSLVTIGTLWFLSPLKESIEEQKDDEPPSGDNEMADPSHGRAAGDR
jgi:putative Mg2+ transporter-C (MgtC) family protein